MMAGEAIESQAGGGSGIEVRGDGLVRGAPQTRVVESAPAG